MKFWGVVALIVGAILLLVKRFGRRLTRYRPEPPPVIDRPANPSTVVTSTTPSVSLMLMSPEPVVAARFDAEISISESSTDASPIPVEARSATDSAVTFAASAAVLSVMFPAVLVT